MMMEIQSSFSKNTDFIVFALLRSIGMCKGGCFGPTRETILHNFTMIPKRALGTIIIFSFMTASLIGCATYKPKPLSPSQTSSSIQNRTLDSSGLREYIQGKLNCEGISWPPGPWDFNMLTLVAFYYHPDLDVARAKWGTAKGAIVTAGQRPNPTLTVTPQYTINPPKGVNPWIVDVLLEFPIETAGKRRSRIIQAKDLSEAARMDLANVAWQVRSRLRTSLVNLYAAEKTVMLQERQHAIQEDLVRLMEKRLVVGEVSQPDLLQVRLALDQARLSLSDAKKKRTEALSDTAIALGLTTNAINGTVISFDFLESPPQALPAGQLRQKALLNRPDILSNLSKYAASESALRLEIAKQYPDLNIGPNYLFDQGQHKPGVGISLTLPIMNQNRGPIAEAKARREEAAAAFLSLQTQVIGEIDRSLAGYQAALQKLGAADSLLSEKKRQQQSTQAMFNAGEVDRLALLSAEFELMTVMLSRLDALVQTQQSLGLLEDSLQYPVDASGFLLPDAEQKPRRTE